MVSPERSIKYYIIVLGTAVHQSEPPKAVLASEVVCNDYAFNSLAILSSASVRQKYNNSAFIPCSCLLNLLFDSISHSYHYTPLVI